MFFETLRTMGAMGGGVKNDPLLIQKRKRRTMKLCTVIAYYIVKITKQLKFLNSHYSIVCSHCFIVCLITKNELKGTRMFKFLPGRMKFTWLIALSTRIIKKCIFFQRGHNFGGGMAGKFWEMSNNRDICCYSNRGWSISKENTGLYI